MKRKSPSFRVYVTPEQKAQIILAAQECKMSVSAYCRTLALGGKPANRMDLEQVKKIESAIANLSRLGNLMKMLLTNDERLQDMGRGMGEVTIDNILIDIRVTNAKLRELVDLVHDYHITPRKAPAEADTP